MDGRSGHAFVNQTTFWMTVGRYCNRTRWDLQDSHIRTTLLAFWCLAWLTFMHSTNVLLQRWQWVECCRTLTAHMCAFFMGCSMPSQLKTLWKFSCTTWIITLAKNKYTHAGTCSMDLTLTLGEMCPFSWRCKCCFVANAAVQFWNGQWKSLMFECDFRCTAKWLDRK